MNKRLLQNLKNEKIILVLFIVYILAILTLMLVSANFHTYDNDEFQHLQMSWLMANGRVPYKDFFEHHTPLYHFIVKSIFFKVKIYDYNSAIKIITNLRIFGILLSGLVLVVTYELARIIAGHKVAIYSSALLCSSIIFLQKSVEIRPDQLGCLFLISSFLLIIKSSNRNNSFIYLSISASLLVLSLFVTQKCLLILPGYIFLYLSTNYLLGKNILHILSPILSGILLSILLLSPLIFYFYEHHAIWNFLYCNFFVVSKWLYKPKTTAWLAIQILANDILLVFLFILGIFIWIQNQKYSPLYKLALFSPLISMLIFIPVFPVVQKQYIYLFIPFVSILSGIGAVYAEDKLFNQETNYLFKLIIPLTIIIHGLSIEGNEFNTSNIDENKKLKYVLEHTSPQDTVLTGWDAGIAFRYPAFFYPSLNEEIRAIIPDESYYELLSGIRAHTVRPVIINMDNDLLNIPNSIIDEIHKDWVPLGQYNLWILSNK